jgi:DNA-damage-inducible protein J
LKSAVINSRIAPEVKEDVESILSRLGMTTTQAITMYFEQIKMKRGLPFSVTLADDAELQAATPQAKGWPEGYFESLAAWEGEDIARPDQSDFSSSRPTDWAE